MLTSFPCNMIIDTGANVVYHSNDLAQKIKRETPLDPTPRVLQTVTGEKIDIHGKLKSRSSLETLPTNMLCMSQILVDPFILGLDFLKGMVSL
ncbi:hypothetical protein TNCV_4920961 [Trichonephila clavipes]|nr:hypothetical protein TNCV_4920961 [Trichonephila clavipes]